MDSETKNPVEGQREDDKAEPTTTTIPPTNDQLKSDKDLELLPAEREDEVKAGKEEGKVLGNNEQVVNGADPSNEATGSEDKADNKDNRDAADRATTDQKVKRSRKSPKKKNKKKEDKASDDESDNQSVDDTGSDVITSDASTTSDDSEIFLNLRSITYMNLAEWTTRKAEFESTMEVLIDSYQDTSIPPPPSNPNKKNTEEIAKEEEELKAPKAGKKNGSLSSSWSKVKALQLMIHSFDLIANFRDIDLKFSWDNSKKGRIVFIRPFKFLVLREMEIRKRFKELEEFHAKRAVPPPPPPPQLHDFVIPAASATSSNLATASSSRSASPSPLIQPSPPLLPTDAAVTRSPRSSPPPQLSTDKTNGENGTTVQRPKHEADHDDLESPQRAKGIEKQSSGSEKGSLGSEQPQASEKIPEDIEAIENEHKKALQEAMEAAEELEKAKKAAEAEAAKLQPSDAPKPPIKFKDAVGRKFSFPWHLCKTWKGIEELIKQAFLHVDIIGPHVDAGHYDLIGPDGEIILPQVWETMVQPDWAVTMQMWPIPEDPLPPPPPPGALPFRGSKNSYDALEDFRLLVRFMDEDMKELFEMRQQIADGTLETIAFDDLWHLFRYGEEVIVQDNPSGEKRAARVFIFTGGRKINADRANNISLPRRLATDALGPGSWEHAFVVQYWTVSYDGSLYWPVENVAGIRPYEGEKSISSLPIFPSKFDRSGTMKQLIEVGNIFKQLTTNLYSHRKYLGKNYDQGSRGEEIDSEVVVDFQEAQSREGGVFTRGEDTLPELRQIDHDFRELWVEYPEHNLCSLKGWCIRDAVAPDYFLDDLEHEIFLRDNKHMVQAKERIDDSEVALLPDYVPGYVLNRKYWAVLSTNKNNLMEFQGTSDPWNDLVLEPQQKVIVEALVAKHLHRPHEKDEIDMPYQLGDFVAGKGRSIVLLLHGPPGVGKTSTAECIAAHMNKPLYPLTSGNLPVRADDLEEKLQVHFTLAARWGCILLLDEADVFLQRRRLNELEINAMVSVFLRQLEYYRGILFLTTNRVGDIDPAFKSRIHVSLEYEPLDRRRTKKIYKLHLMRIKEALEMRRTNHGSNFKVNSEEILVWSDQHFKKASKRHRQWNGRQIHNAFQTAVALAEWEARTKNPKTAASAHDNSVPELVLGKKHFKQVAQVSEGFDQYMTDLMGGRNEADVAAVNAQRYDFRPHKTPEPKKPESSSESDDDSGSDGNLIKKDDSDSDSDTRQKKKGKGKGKKKALSSDSSSDEGAKRTPSKRKGKKKEGTSEDESSDEIRRKKSSRPEKEKEKKKGRSKRRDSNSDSD